MARSTFLPNLAKNKGGKPARNSFKHDLGTDPTVARSFTWNGTVQTHGSTFSLSTKGCSDAKAKELWEQGFLDF